MHHLGMLALAIPSVLTFEPAHTAVSIAIGCALSGAATWTALQREDGRHLAAATLFLPIAIAGLHFTRLAGTTLVLDGRPVGSWAPDGPWLAIAVAVAVLAACAGASFIS